SATTTETRSSTTTTTAYHSASRPLSPADRDTIRQQQQHLLEQSQQQRDELERATPLARPPQPAPEVSTPGPCFTVHTITLDNATLISPRAQDRLLAEWRGQCLDMAHITQLTNTVSDWYISRGYITSRAFLTEQDLSSGTLHIAVLEGHLQAVRLGGKPDRQLKMAFPNPEGRILNLRDIEQGMEQINRLRSTPVQIEILPGDSAGYSIVNLTATPEFPFTGSVSFDNSGQKSTGTGQFGGALTGNNLLGIADKWFVSGGRSSDFSSSHDAQNFAAGVSVPYGYGLLDYSYSYSNYQS
ncbi:ShlB/FhaC/HecB family hemolysin secretion/activation protein, partial [Tenebrionicola larvae]